MSELKNNSTKTQENKQQENPINAKSEDEFEAKELEVIEEQISREEYIPLYKKSWFIWFSLVVFAPIGIFFLWKYTTFKPWHKALISLIFAGYFIYTIIYPDKRLFGF